MMLKLSKGSLYENVIPLNSSDLVGTHSPLKFGSTWILTKASTLLRSTK